MSDRITVEYDEVNRIANSLTCDTEMFRNAILRLASEVRASSGAWEGEAANAMREYFESRILPLTEQLHDLIEDKIGNLKMATEKLMDTDESLSRMF